MLLSCFFVSSFRKLRTIALSVKCLLSLSNKMNKKIIIIGAGAAGMAAATKLISNGFRNLTILEAENRIGGRINTVPYASNVLDMGAQW